MNMVIETNISIDDKGQIADHQSRIIQVESWESYIEEIKSGETKYRTSYLGNLHGRSLPRVYRVDNLVFDDFHMSCDVYNSQDALSKKFSFLVD